MSDKTQRFIIRAKEVHGDKFDYSQVNYVSRSTKVAISCSVHGIFWQQPNNHLNGDKCPGCRGLYKKGTPERASYQLQKAQEIHGDKYDYSMIDLSNVGNDKVSIVCPQHGQFTQLWNNHVSKIHKNGCPKCGRVSTFDKTMLGNAKFISKAQKTHGTKYDYTDVNYQGAHKKVTIICGAHGPFECTPANHWHRGVGCTKCINSNPSRGEAKIASWLAAQNIPYEYQKSYPDLWYKAKNGRLKYDFYLPTKNLLIEYDGEHHTQPISWSKKIDGVERLKAQQIKDQLKESYALKHGIQLLRINFDQDIQETLAKTIT